MQEKAEFLTSEEFSNEVRDMAYDDGSTVMVREFWGAVKALARQIATLKGGRQVEIKAAEQEVIKLRAEVAQQNAEGIRRVSEDRDRVKSLCTVQANVELKRRRDKAEEVIGGIQVELDDANEKVRLGKEEKKSLEAAKDAAEMRAQQLAQEVAALSGVRERLRKAEEKVKVLGVEVECLKSEVAIQAQLRREAEEKPEVPPPIFNLFSMGKEKLPAPAPKGVDVGVNMEEVAEPVEEEKMECVGPDGW